jgi:fused signal recognition particle receptor
VTPDPAAVPRADVSVAPEPEPEPEPDPELELEPEPVAETVTPNGAAEPPAPDADPAQ